MARSRGPSVIIRSDDNIGVFRMEKQNKQLGLEDFRRPWQVPKLLHLSRKNKVGDSHFVQA